MAQGTTAKQSSFLEIWQQQRKLLPQLKHKSRQRLYCIQGAGVLRAMAKAEVIPIHANDFLELTSDEIITISTTSDMKIQLSYFN